MVQKTLAAVLTEASSEDTDDLLSKLGEQTLATMTDDELDLEQFGFLPGWSTLDLGRKVFSRFSRELHGVICGTDPENAEHRSILLKSIQMDKLTLTAAVTTLLETTLGLGFPIAPIIAVLLVRSVFVPAGNELCQYWASQLQNT